MASTLGLLFATLLCAKLDVCQSSRPQACSSVAKDDAQRSYATGGSPSSVSHGPSWKSPHYLGPGDLCYVEVKRVNSSQMTLEEDLEEMMTKETSSYDALGCHDLGFHGALGLLRPPEKENASAPLGAWPSHGTKFGIECFSSGVWQSCRLRHEGKMSLGKERVFASPALCSPSCRDQLDCVMGEPLLWQFPHPEDR